MPQLKPATASNIFVFVCIDDMSPPKLLEEAVQFNSPLQIPNITALAAEMMFFDNMQAVVPICKASRTAMLSSVTPIKSRVWSNDAEDYILWDFNDTWMAEFKLRGETDAIGKVSHDVDCPIPIREACYTRFHELQKYGVSQVAIASQSGISGTANQVFRGVRLLSVEPSSGKAAFCDVTLNAAGNAIATVVMVEKTRVDDKITEVDPRYQLGISGEDYAVGDQMRIEGLGLDETTGKFSMPGANLVLNVEKVSSYKQFTDEGSYGYGAFTEAATVEKGDTVMTDYLESVIADLINTDNDQSLRVITLGLKGPHSPLIPGQTYLDMHPLANITIPTGYDLPSSYVLRFLEASPATQLYNAGKLQEYAQHYLAVVEELDARLGDIVQTLKDNDLWDRANVVFWSDHSFNIGNQNSASLPQGILKKFQAIGTATSCFFAMRTPLYTSGGVVTEPVSALDIGPTMLEMAGIPIPAYMEGKSLMPAMRRPTTWANDRAALSFCFGNISAVKAVSLHGVRTVLRLIRMFNGEELLFNEETDPLNKSNLVADTSYAAALVLMQAAMDAELERLGWVAGNTGTDEDDLLMRATAGGALAGGLGGDTYIIAATNTAVTDTGGQDVIVLQPLDVGDTDYTVPSGIETLIVEETADGGTITLPSTGTIVIGPVDVLTGGAGNDAIYGSGNGLTATMGAGADYVYSTGGNDSVLGEGGDDTIRGLGGIDTIYGGANADSLNGGGGADQVFGDDGADIIYGGDDADTLTAGTGNDTVWGGVGSDIIYGGDNADSISGGGGADSLYGGSGNDTLRPGAGAGNDLVDAGSGTNVIQVGISTGSFTIQNWTTGTNVIQFNEGCDLGPLVGVGTGTQTAAELFVLVQAAGADSGADWVLTVPATGETITILGRNEVNFTSADFTVAQFDEDEGEDDDNDGGE